MSERQVIVDLGQGRVGDVQQADTVSERFEARDILRRGVVEIPDQLKISYRR